MTEQAIQSEQEFIAPNFDIVTDIVRTGAAGLATSVVVLLPAMATSEMVLGDTAREAHAAILVERNVDDLRVEHAVPLAVDGALVAIGSILVMATTWRAQRSR